MGLMAVPTFSKDWVNFLSADELPAAAACRRGRFSWVPKEYTSASYDCNAFSGGLRLQWKARCTSGTDLW
jgi:hypothetical protein